MDEIITLSVYSLFKKSISTYLFLLVFLCTRRHTSRMIIAKTMLSKMHPTAIAMKMAGESLEREGGVVGWVVVVVAVVAATATVHSSSL